MSGGIPVIEAPEHLGQDRLTAALSLVKDLPPLSPMLRHLLATVSAGGEDTSLGEVANWIERDTLMAGKVLALANSGLYGRSVPILSVRQAVARLGLDAVRNLVLSVSMTGFWSRLPMPESWSISRFNTHSIATALLSETMSSVLAPEEMDSAFLAGLFHDIGQLVMAVLLRDDLPVLERLGEEEHVEETEIALVGFSHAELSAAIVRSWNLPAAIERAVRYHENPQGCPDGRGPRGVVLCDIVHSADRYVDCQGLSVRGTARTEEDKAHAFQELGLGIKDAGVLAHFQERLDVLLSIL